MANNSGGPWGGGSRGGGSNGGDDDDRRPGRRPGSDQPQIPEIDEIMKKGQEQLRVLMGGRGGNRPNGGDGGDDGPRLTRGTILLGLLAAVALWTWNSLYTVRPEEQSVELFLGEFSAIGNPGLNFAPWPVVSYEIVPVTREQSEDIGLGRSGSSGGDGLMLTTDEAIVDIDFQVVWNINNPAEYLFNLRDGPQTVRAVSESAMREIVAGSDLAPLLNRDRAAVAQRAEELIQSTLNSYESGINIVRVNLRKADPPAEVID
ncbi:MAG: protease modulator HflK, partial [Boseongicola sp.]|nr:protease modulator HflK [Boseongicola sp.]